MVEDTRRRGHHHGNAREALIAAATEMLEGAGAANLSLRGVAERAGLSRQAPYNHFADKEAMLAALVTTGFDRLAQELEDASAGLIGEAALAGTGEAYIAFAQTSPALFRLMFAREIVDTSKFPEAAAAGAKAFAIMVAAVTSLTAAEKVEEVSMAAWCIVHGYATLCNEASLEAPERCGDRARQFTHMIATAAKTA